MEFKEGPHRLRVYGYHMKHSILGFSGLLLLLQRMWQLRSY
jgi:hypothetical protein